MICTGCGIAPFRSFWTERSKDIEANRTGEKRFGELVLFFGCREETKDFLYKNELTSLKEKNVLTAFFTAFSRDPIHPKVHKF